MLWTRSHTKPNFPPGLRLAGLVLAACLVTPLVSAQDEPGQSPHIRQVLSAQYRTTIRQHHSQLIVAERNIARIAITAPEVANFVQYSTREVGLVGLTPGSTDLTIWFEDDPRPIIYEVRVESAVQRSKQPVAVSVPLHVEVQEQLAEVFPRSRVRLVPVGEQIVVQGQAWDAAEADLILQIVTAQFARGDRQVVNTLRIPGEFQVMLQVQIAELNRTRLRRLGVNTRDLLKRARQASGFGPTSAGISGVLSSNEAGRLVKWLSSHGTISYVAEPSLTVLSGHAASFLSGGQFAVSEVDANGRRQTRFHDYGTSLHVTPTILDRDLIRLQIAPEFSQVNTRHAVDGVPGTNVRRVETVVELREGQTIAIGGLVAREMQSAVSERSNLRRRLFPSRNVAEAETELLILVTPEIVRPMDPGEIPPLPNQQVTRPSDTELFVDGRGEGAQPFTENTFVPGSTEVVPRDPALAGSRPASVLPQPELDAISTGGPVIQPPTPGSSGSAGGPLFDLPTGPDKATLPPPVADSRERTVPRRIDPGPAREIEVRPATVSRMAEPKADSLRQELPPAAASGSPSKADSNRATSSPGQTRKPQPQNSRPATSAGPAQRQPGTTIRQSRPMPIPGLGHTLPGSRDRTQRPYNARPGRSVGQEPKTDRKPGQAEKVQAEKVQTGTRKVPLRTQAAKTRSLPDFVGHSKPTRR